jgi:hypothetical protein
MDPDAPPSVDRGPGVGRNESHRLSVPADPRPGVTSGVRGNLGEQGGKRQPDAPLLGPKSFAKSKLFLLGFGLSENGQAETTHRGVVLGTRR